MNILVCISKTPETTAKISFTGDNTQFSTDGVQFIMNPYDEWYALVRAIELVEKNGGNVTAINVGPASNDVIIRKALAIGANDAVRVDSPANSAMDVAVNIADHAKDKSYDLIICGKETIDYSGALVPGMVAEILDLPFVSFATSIDKEGGDFHVTREIEGGQEKVALNGSIVISAAKGLAEQRIPNMRGIMMAKRKPLEVKSPVSTSEASKITSYQLPEAKGGVKMMDPENMDELVRLLHEEAKVI